MEKRITLLSLLLIAVTAMAQERFHIQSYGDMENFYTHASTCLMKDKKGFLWVGSSRGIYVFDGIFPRSMTIPNEEEGEGSFSDRVTAMVEDNEENIWLGTKRAFYMINMHTEKLERWTAPGLPERGQVTHLLIDSKERIWALIDRVAYIIYPKENAVKKVSSSVFHPNCMMLDYKGKVWMASDDGKIYYYDEATSQLRSLNLTEDGNFKPYVQAMTEMSCNIIALTTNLDGVVLFDTEKKTGQRLQLHGEADARIVAFCAATPDQRHLWIGTERGILICDVTDGSTIALRQRNNTTNTLSDNAVHSLCATDRGTMWAGTYFGGLNKISFDQGHFRTILPNDEQQDVNVVRPICRDSKGRLWVGTEDGSLYLYDCCTCSLVESGINWGNHIPAFNVQSLMAIDDELWVSTLSGGIYVVDVNTLQVKRNILTSGGMHPQFFGVVNLCRRGKDILAATGAGLYAYDHEAGEFYVVPQLSTGYLHHLYCDSKGRFWATTTNRGLWEVTKDKKGEWKAEKTAFSHQCATTIMEDARGRLWVGTDNQGLLRYDPETKKTEQVKASPRLCRQTVTNIVEDKNHILWVSSFDGLYRYDTDKEQMTRFSVANGLPTNRLNYMSSYVDEGGCIFLGTHNGLVRFNPADFEGPKEKLKPYLFDLYVNGRRISPGDDTGILSATLMCTEDIELDHTQSAVAIFYAIPSYQYGTNVWFRYRLNPEEPWRVNNTGEPVMMMNRPAGTYYLELQASYDPEVWEGETVTLRIKVSSSPWTSPWAIMAYIALIALAIWLYLRRGKKGKTKEQEENAVIETDDTEEA